MAAASNADAPLFAEAFARLLPHRRELATGVDVAVAPAAVATRTGLAVAYADAAGALWFWHGSVERIISGPPVPSAVRLDAPPDHVAAS